MRTIVKYFHTIRYLKYKQIFWRIKYKLYKSKIKIVNEYCLRQSSDNWVKPAEREQSLFDGNIFIFLNKKKALKELVRWESKDEDKLWLYNLHYFDDLNAKNASERRASHSALIETWISENIHENSTGWQPYPLSIRTINWIKWAFSGNKLTNQANRTLATQARFLMSSLEYHLLGNHLFTNAKALIFAGCFFRGHEANLWLIKGIEILLDQLNEQILDDGGHFERSPMYHALALEDVLDIYNIYRNYPEVQEFFPSDFTQNISVKIKKMLHWLAVMSHPDGKIAFFNDAAFKIAPENQELEKYAARLGFEQISISHDEVIYLKDSGYIRVQNGDVVLLMDAAPIGPEYLPGHAHADTLSIEISLFNQRFIVNGGTSCYGTSERRQIERSTNSHNTVVIEGQDSSEVWSGFRVARRAYPFDVSIQINNEKKEVFISASHDGYTRLAGKPIHTRNVLISKESLIINDLIIGRYRDATAKIQFAPQIKVLDFQENNCVLEIHKNKNIELKFDNGKKFDYFYSPEFGLRERSIGIETRIECGVSDISINWSNS